MSESPLFAAAARQAAIRTRLEEANAAYRTGEAIMSDAEYDALMDELQDPLFKARIGHSVERRKVALPVPMGSLVKVKSHGEIVDWLTSKRIPAATTLCATPKYDGLSLLVEFRAGRFHAAATRGDGIEGQDVSSHFAATALGRAKLPEAFTGFFIGEAIMPDEVFASKHAAAFKNPRNMVAGLLARKEISPELEDVTYCAYAVRHPSIPLPDKLSQIAFCNTHLNALHGYTVPHLLANAAALTDETLRDFFAAERRYTCDGLVLEVNDHALFHELGQESSSLNPAGARAWKPQSDDSRTVSVRSLSWQVSRNGLLKPVVQIEPVDLAGVTISNVTGINARFIRDSRIGSGAAVTIIRSGDVIPKIISTPLPAALPDLPTSCPSCSGPVVWNDNEVELVCHCETCPARQLSGLVDFFKIVGCDDLGEGSLAQLQRAGFSTVAAILNLKREDLLALEGFKERKADKVLESMRRALTQVPYARLQHASGLFRGLGEKRLEVLCAHRSLAEKPSQEYVCSLFGFDAITAAAYLEGYDAYLAFAATLPDWVSVTAASPVCVDGPLSGQSYVFTGFRDEDLEKRLKALGASIGSGVSKKTSALVIKAAGSGSSKAQKATELGVKVMDRDSLDEFLKTQEKP